MAAIDNAEAKITALDTVTASVETLVTTMAADIRALREAGTDPATAARIQALADKADSLATRLAVAVKAGTDAEDETV